jgi:hypothetical protein
MWSNCRHRSATSTADPTNPPAFVAIADDRSQRKLGPSRDGARVSVIRVGRSRTGGRIVEAITSPRGPVRSLPYPGHSGTGG